MSAEELLDAVRHLPDQVRDIAVVAADVEGLPDVDGVTQVVIFGVGGGRVAADVIEAICQLRGTVPIIATGGRCPSWVSESTLAIAVSRSGNSPATLAAVDDARERGARLIAVTSGGALASACSDQGILIVSIDPDSGPSATLGVTIVPVLVLLERLGFVTGMSRTISATASQLASRLRDLDDHGAIIRLVDVLVGRVAIVTAAGAIGKHAARRWVQELDRVGGVASVRRRLPTGETDVETGVRLAEATSAGAVLILLRHDYEPDGLDGGVALLEGRFDEIHSFEAQGETPLAQLLDLVLLADVVAAVLAHRTSG